MSSQKLKNRFLHSLRVFGATSFSPSGSLAALTDPPLKCRRRPGANEGPAAKVLPKAQSTAGPPNDPFAQTLLISNARINASLFTGISASLGATPIWRPYAFVMTAFGLDILGLVSSRHRLTMCQLAVQSSDWIRVDPWECYQDTWQTTCSVLEHHRDLMKRVTGCILSNVNTPSMTPVIGQPQNESPQPIYQNSNISNKPTAAKILGKVGESLSRICCVRPPMERFTFVDENANLGTVMRYEEIELRILLLCGSDLLESFCIPGLWNESDMEVIVGDFGIVVVPRDGTDTDRIMNHSSILRKYKNNILVVKDDMNHPMSVVSSTKSRLALQHGDGHVVDYLSQPVIDYILKSQLYINASG
ncbi:Nicotinamide mononucleotide adenylyltransferase 2 [Chelonia mydas]|uniref:Nicotinamide mononucleotide adenylyltransferase 2 n=1 Tax=Chelonia mydas TaxID=8469 RepID=M7BFS8_CHEMY|nr:Nicotinamide mononucleotide adenylyltransferase 2 [Chelonia mydas]